MKKETIQKVINFVITVLTAVLSSFCVQAASDILVLPQISRIYTDNLVASNSYHQTSMEKLRRS